MKVVINNCFGGFSISARAVKEYAKRKGRECYFFEYDYSNPVKYTPVPDEKAFASTWFPTAFSIPNPNEYKMEGPDNRWHEFHISDSDFDRTDPDLIAIIEQLGEKANGTCAQLKIVEIPDETDYVIKEYDGNEHIAETHKTWS